jgi:anti-anti-sigma regulatory factor
MWSQVGVDQDPTRVCPDRARRHSIAGHQAALHPAARGDSDRSAGPDVSEVAGEVASVAAATPQPVLRRLAATNSGTLLLTAVDDLDLATEDEARADLDAALEDCSPTRDCLIDACDVYVDVRGLAALLYAAERAHKHGARLSVCPPRSVRTSCRALQIGNALPLIDPSSAPKK